MCPVVVKDELPRLIAYPIGERLLRHELGPGLPAEDELGVFLLYTSGVQVDLYDPVTSRAKSYPVLVFDRGIPDLTSEARARLREQSEKLTSDERPIGMVRADEQLRARDLDLGP